MNPDVSHAGIVYNIFLTESSHLKLSVLKLLRRGPKGQCQGPKVSNSKESHPCSIRILNNDILFIKQVRAFLFLFWMCVSHSIMSEPTTSWTEACQAPLSMTLPRREYWSGLSCPSVGDPPNPGIKSMYLALQVDSLPSEPRGKPYFEQCHEISYPVTRIRKRIFAINNLFHGTVPVL